MSKKIIESQKVNEIIQKIEELQRELADLLDSENFFEELSVIESTIDKIKGKINETVAIYCSKINFSDEGYKLRRIIDGDTISVDPPVELKRWMKDINVRLYGVDTPELKTKRGDFYRKFLIEILESNNYRKIIIIWDREKSTNIYGNFPTNSFLRSHGNLFLEYDDRLIYLNSLLLMLPEVATYYKSTNLIKGRKSLAQIFNDSNHYFNCHSKKPVFIQEILQKFFKEEDHSWINSIPLCLISFPSKIFQSELQSPNDILEGIIESIKKEKCPFYFLQEILEINTFNEKIANNTINPFDIILLAVEKWKNNIQNNKI